MAICDNCWHEVQPVADWAPLPVGGLWFSQKDLGYYDGFFDVFPSVGCEPTELGLCHECCVLFMEALPGLADKLLPLRGGHPTRPWVQGTASPPCCAWAWTWDEEAPCGVCAQSSVYVANANGEWEKRECQGCVVVVSTP